MSIPLGIPFAVGTLMAMTSAGISAPSPGTTAAAADVTPVAAHPLSRARVGLATASSSGKRLEVWTAPSRIAKIKSGRSRIISVNAVETMAEWRTVKAVISARSTAGRITPKQAQSSKGNPADFTLTRKSGSSNFGFTTFTATTRKYGTAKRVVSWGRVPLPRTLSGTLTRDTHDEESGQISNDRDEWKVTFQLVTRSSGKWMGAAVYRLSHGTWAASSSSSAPDNTCMGAGSGKVTAGTLRYDWRGKSISTGAGAYWIDLTSSQGYRVTCSHHEYTRHPQYTLGFKPATGGIHPEHLKGRRSVSIDSYFDTQTWNLSAS